MNTQLSFHTTKFNVVNIHGQVWLSAPEVAQALEYADQSSVNRIYARHSDEFTEQMSGSVKLTDPKGDQQETRIFSLRGAHLIAMFARTPVAKEFRKWVLDILDREIGLAYPVQTDKCYSVGLTTDDLCHLAWLFKAATHLRNEAEYASKGLRELQSPFGATLGTMSVEYKYTIEKARKVLQSKIDQVPCDELLTQNWRRVLPDIKIH